ncbi:oxamate carbamoyltransferase subunit AllG family protein [Leucobacter sp. GX24907]
MNAEQSVPISDLFAGTPRVVNVGLEMFVEDLAAQGARVVPVDWSPPGGGDPAVIAALEVLERPENIALIDAANQQAIDRIVSAQPMLIGFERAIDVIPGMTPTTILHAGPPIEFQRMSGPMRGAVTGALVFEGLAADVEEAARLAASGAIDFAPCHEHQAVGSMAGVTSASMFVHVVENATHGNRAYTNLSEQLAKVLRMGANDHAVIDRLVWMRDTLGPVLQQAIAAVGPIDLRLMLAQALHMGDECHNRNVAGTALLAQALAPGIVQADFDADKKVEVLEFIASSDYFSGPTWMATAKAALDAAHGIPGSSVVVTMARNGVEHGVRVSGLEEEGWFVGAAQRVVGPMFAGYKPEDAGLDIGDSAITETYGFGGFAMSAAPAITALVGGTAEDAIEVTHRMGGITVGRNPNVTIPLLDFVGLPTGIDVRSVAASGVLPVINTAIAHREAGIGMIGAGITHPPIEAFHSAVVALAERLSGGSSST